MLRTHTRALVLAFIFSVTLLISSASSLMESQTIPSIGMISYSVRVNINFAKTDLRNSLAVATQDIRTRQIHPYVFQKEKAQACRFKLWRLLIGTWGSFGLNPCIAWDETAHMGTYDWTLLDDWIETVRAMGAEPLLCIGGKDRLPPGMSVDPAAEEGWSLYVEDFAKYCADIVYHCNVEKGYGVKYWEVWNEPSWVDADSIVEFTAIFNTVQAQMYGVDASILFGNDRCTTKHWADYYAEHITGLGFASFHKYDTGDPAESEAVIMERASDLKRTWMEEPPYQMEYYLPAEAASLLAVPFLICSETNIDWASPDSKHNTMFQSAWYAEELRAFVLDGNIAYSVCYAFADHINYYGMVEDYPPYTLWHPYHVNYLIGNNLNVGDPICESSSDDFGKISTLAWKHGNEYKLLIIGKAPELVRVTVSLPVAVGSDIKIQRIISITGYTSALQEETFSYTEPLIISLDGYSVTLLTIMPI